MKIFFQLYHNRRRTFCKLLKYSKYYETTSYFISIIILKIISQNWPKSELLTYLYLSIINEALKDESIKQFQIWLFLYHNELSPTPIHHNLTKTNIINKNLLSPNISNFLQNRAFRAGWQHFHNFKYRIDNNMAPECHTGSMKIFWEMETLEGPDWVTVTKLKFIALI